MHGGAPVRCLPVRNWRGTTLSLTGVATTCPFPMSRAPSVFVGSRTWEVRNYGGILRSSPAPTAAGDSHIVEHDCLFPMRRDFWLRLNPKLTPPDPKHSTLLGPPSCTVSWGTTTGSTLH